MKTVRCDKGDYYVMLFKVSSTQKMTAQVNLKGDFYPDSGYLHGRLFSITRDSR